MKIELPPEHFTQKFPYRLAMQIACLALVLIVYTHGEWLYWSPLMIVASAFLLGLFIVINDIALFNLKKVSAKGKGLLCIALIMMCVLLAWLDANATSADIPYLAISVLCIPVLVFDLLPRIFLRK